MTHRFTNRIAGWMILAFASTAFLVSQLDAAVPGAIPPNAAKSKPESPPFGKTYDVLSLEWWLWDFMQAAPVNPTFGNGPCTSGQSGDVWFLYGLIGPASSVTCVIPGGKSLFLPIVNTECSSLEPFPFHGDTAHERQACADAWMDHVSGLALKIDGKSVQNFAPLRTRSGDFSFTVPDNSILGVPGPAWGFSSADGYYALLSPLSAGVHTIQIKATIKDPFDPMHPVVGTIDTTLTLLIGH